MYVCACLTSSSMDRTSLQNSFSTVEKGTSYKAIKYNVSMDRYMYINHQ